MVHAIEHLPRKCKTQSSNPSTAKKKERKKRKITGAGDGSVVQHFLSILKPWVLAPSVHKKKKNVTKQ
jgi:hypothetical protein